MRVLCHMLACSEEREQLYRTAKLSLIEEATRFTLGVCELRVGRSVMAALTHRPCVSSMAAKA